MCSTSGGVSHVFTDKISRATAASCGGAIDVLGPVITYLLPVSVVAICTEGAQISTH